MAAEKFLKGFYVNFKRRIVADMALNDFDYVLVDGYGVFPMIFKPFLELCHFSGALDLDV
ncbi:MAG: hypothetical protein Q7R35_08160 [Elusimicrobiota bacterium]|nr:hypothetical protein [Elusimicrobiota bacterium]